MIDTGIIVRPEVFKTRNIIIGLLAVSFFGLRLCNSCIAFSPTGVAALSSPSILAEKFINIDPNAGCPLGISGKSLVSTGLRKLAKRCTKPLSSPIFSIPIHRVSVPVSPNVISNPTFEASNVESIIAGKAS